MLRIKTGRTLLVALLSSVTFNAYAVGPGFYMGFAGGPATNNGSEQTVATLSGTPPTTTATPRSQQFASHIYMGNKINDYAGFELGLTFFSGIKYSTAVPAEQSLVARVRDIDLVGKVDYPMGGGFDVFGKAGVGYTYISTSGGLNSDGQTQYQSKFAPTFGIGVSYDLNQNWVMDLSANTLLVSGLVSRVSYVGLGFSYHFVNKYCGQFLCDD